METLKFTVPLLAICRLIKMNPKGVERNALQFRSGLNKEEITKVIAKFQEDKLIAIIGKGRGTKFIKGSEFDKAFVEL